MDHLGGELGKGHEGAPHACHCSAPYVIAVLRRIIFMGEEEVRFVKTFWLLYVV